MTKLDQPFTDTLKTLGEPFPRFKWYLSVIVCLAALNYPEEIPGFYTLLLEKGYIPEEARFDETRKIREGLTKICGIQGAAKTGNALRALASVVPEELRDTTHHRKDDTDEIAIPRGRAFYERIYGPNKDHKASNTIAAGPDYYWIAQDLYAHVFSFDKILTDLETGQCIVSCLIGIDCQEQVRNHMKGMLYNGASREEIGMVREVCIRTAERVGVKFKTGPVAVPVLDDAERNGGRA